MTETRVALLHPTGNGNVRQALASFLDAAVLHEYATTVGRSSDSPVPRLLPASIAGILSKRTYDLPKDKLRRRVREEVFRNILLRSPNRRLRRLGEPWQRFGIGWVSDELDKAYSRRLASGVDLPTVLMAYQGMGSRSFDSAVALGIPRVLEVTHAHWRVTEATYERSNQNDPDWATTITFPLGFAKREVDAQLKSASLVLSPSRQVTESLSGIVSRDRLLEVPYGCPPVLSSSSTRSFSGMEPLRVLYVGRVQAGKGLAQLARAKEALGTRIELTIIGAAPNVQSSALEGLLSSSRYLGTQSQSVVRSEMDRAHTFVMPSLVEGRSLAALEAMSAGLSMIVTPGSGVDDLVEIGAGIVVPSGDGNALTTAFEQLLSNPKLVEQFSSVATTIAQANGWETYRAGLLQALQTAAERRSSV